MDLSRMPKEGDKFGNWILERTLDSGGMGMVYLAYNPDLGKSGKVALKVLDPAVAEKDADFVKRFYQEASIVFKTRCENLVAIHDAGRDEASGFYYIVMEYLGGGTLRGRLEETGPLPWREALSITRAVATALVAVAKRGSVHRDIKPENIMFTADGVVKLADFGIAKAPPNEEELLVVTQPEQVFGTPQYMSPEQIRDASSVDPRADIWSLGIVLFEMLAGARPCAAKTFVETAGFILSPEPIPDLREFVRERSKPTGTSRVTYAATLPCGEAKVATPPTEAELTIPDGVALLVARMCEKNRDKRIATSEDVLRAIDRLLGEAEQQRGAGAFKMVAVGFGVFLTVLGVLAFVLVSRPARNTTQNPPPRPTQNLTPHPTQGLTPRPTPRPVVPEIVTPQEKPTPSPKAAPAAKAAPLSPFFQPADGTIDDVLARLEEAIAARPAQLRVSLSPFAQKEELSPERFENQLLVPAVERLRQSEVKFSLLPGGGTYGAIVQDVARRFGCDVE